MLIVLKYTPLFVFSTVLKLPFHFLPCLEGAILVLTKCNVRICWEYERWQHICHQPAHTDIFIILGLSIDFVDLWEEQGVHNNGLDGTMMPVVHWHRSLWSPLVTSTIKHQSFISILCMHRSFKLKSGWITLDSGQQYRKILSFILHHLIMLYIWVAR